MLDSCNFSSVTIVVLKIRKLVKLAAITEITQVSNVYLKILDQLIIMRCSQKKDIVRRRIEFNFKRNRNIHVQVKDH